jgi:hypothetical protein
MAYQPQNGLDEFLRPARDRPVAARFGSNSLLPDGFA